MGSGTEVARESAAVLLLGNDLLRFTDVLKVARRCRNIIYANFVGTLLVDGVGVGLAAFGMLNPVLAALIHVSSELLFIANSAHSDPDKKLHQVFRVSAHLALYDRQTRRLVVGFATGQPDENFRNSSGAARFV
jgi:hypothetical protein